MNYGELWVITVACLAIALNLIWEQLRRVQDELEAFRFKNRIFSVAIDRGGCVCFAIRGKKRRIKLSTIRRLLQGGD